MKKFAVFACAAMLVFGVAGMAKAASVVDVINFYEDFADPVTATQQVNPDDLETGYGGNSLNKIESGFDYLEYYHRFTFDPAFAQLNSAELVIELKDDNDDITFFGKVIKDKWDEYGLIDQSGVTWDFGGEIDPGNYNVPNVDVGLMADGDFHVSIFGDFNCQLGFSDFIVVSSTLTIDYDPVPEPSTVLLLGAGVLGLVGFGRKKFKK